jgi:biopolymer transport protein ExbD/biopolymer transport protein TolR
MAMTMGTGGRKGGVAPTMNVTPLVDVVLVLLILFMVLTPMMNKKFWIHTPKQEKKELDQPQDANPTPPLVLRVMPDKTIMVNSTTLTFEELPDRLKRMFAARDDHVLFVDIDDELPYAFAVDVLDQARAGGAVTIAALTKPLSSPAPAQ